MNNNHSAFPDEDGAFYDWIEITNGGSSAVNLSKLTLADLGKLSTVDSLEEAATFHFPDKVLQAGESLVVYLTGNLEGKIAFVATTHFAGINVCGYGAHFTYGNGTNQGDNLGGLRLGSYYIIELPACSNYQSRSGKGNNLFLRNIFKKRLDVHNTPPSTLYYLLKEARYVSKTWVR
jgi:hypothetical protein